MATITITTTGIARSAAVGTATLYASLVTPCASTFFTCRKTTTQACKTWKFVYPDCANNVLQCNATKGAYVAAVTACELGL